MDLNVKTAFGLADGEGSMPDVDDDVAPEAAESTRSDAAPAPVADLHLHTTASDGTLTVADLPTAARAGDVGTVAVTDHDCVHPALDAPVTVHDGVTVIRGIELRVDTGSQKVDLLGYAVDPTPELEAELARIQENRQERAREIRDRVESHLGVTLDLDIREGVGRPHIARAIETSEADYGYQGAFDHLIGNGEPCYVAREVTSFERGLDLLSASCAVVGLAHPFRYPDVEAALALTDDLDAVERYYPYGRPVDTDRLDAVIEANDLLATGGSDAHDTTLGRAGPPREAFERFAARLPRA
jgi:predicted metal-dependent phosphoesterase TrpH